MNVLFKISTQLLFITFRRFSTHWWPSLQDSHGKGGGPARWQRMADRQQQAAPWALLGTERGWEEGAWPRSPRVAEDPHRAEPSVLRGLHHPWHRRAGGQGSVWTWSQPAWCLAQGKWEPLWSGNKQPNSAQRGSCCNKRLLERGRAGWNSQENSPDPGLLTPSREEQPPCTSWAPVLSLRKRNQPGVPCLGISKCPGCREGLSAVWEWAGSYSAPSTSPLGAWLQEGTLSIPLEVHHFASLSAAGGSRDQPLHTRSLLLSLPYQKGW